MSTSSQDFIPIREIRDGVVVLKDGSLRSVIMTSSINFALKSADEQDAIVFQFQNFLNSINFTIQIMSQSRRLDIRPYLALLQNVMKEQRNDLLKIQTREYIEFIKSFAETVNVMSKSFFVVVPYSPALIQGKGNTLAAIAEKSPIHIPGMSPKKSDSQQRSESFEENRTQLEERAGVVIQGLMRIGVRAVPLGTDELVELYYKLFNPGETDKPISLGQGGR